MSSSSERYATTFPSINIDRFTYASDVLHQRTPEELAEWVKQNTVTQKLGSQTYKMIVSEGSSDPGTVILSAGELGNGLDALGAIARILAIRDVVNPGASIVYQPNTTFSESNMNFSRTERRSLKQGDARPLTGRILQTLDSLKPTKIVAYGPSQGATTILSLAADSDAPNMSVAVIETPNILRRSALELAADYSSSGKLLNETVSSNFDTPTKLQKYLLQALKLKGTAFYALGLLKPDNLALLGLMRTDTAKSDMERILQRGGSLVHSWATETNVSPADINESIRADLSQRFKESYKSFVIEGDHSRTNDYLFSAGLVAELDP